jgi:hypothetical protein
MTTSQDGTNTTERHAGPSHEDGPTAREPAARESEVSIASRLISTQAAPRRPIDVLRLPFVPGRAVPAKGLIDPADRAAPSRPPPLPTG